MEIKINSLDEVYADDISQAIIVKGASHSTAMQMKNVKQLF